MTSKQINQFIRKNYKMSFNELAAHTGLSYDAVWKRYKTLKLPVKEKEIPVPPKEQIAADLQKLSAKKDRLDTETKYEMLLLELESACAERDAIKQLAPIDTFKIHTAVANGKSEATAVAVASDWHIEEDVAKQQVNGLNEFTLDIATTRAEAFFANALRLLKINQQDITIKTMVLALLGDFISGSIHEDLAEGNNLPPIKALLFAQNLIASGIEFLLANSDVNLVIPCHSGNHGRSTMKQRHAMEAGNSFEFFMYHNLANYFKGEKRVKFIIPEGYLSYLEVYDTVIRFHHGHAIKYGGGIGGIFIPAFKAIGQWNKSRWATVDVFGHFHQQRNGGNFLCNGSLIGYNAYAIAIKAEFEKPAQTFFLVHNKHGIEAVNKIRLE